ncbi:very short patch repair endonuclease [Dokdonella sp.]|uniref:very short patch repair endonuclease n=1 Tax=Dokdonella sp. TaxID=2291710 RepID=UPI00352962AD
MMSRIRSKNTKPETLLRSGLWRQGFRFRLHAQLPGKPDILLPRWNVVVFVNGCFWHAHVGCRYFRLPSTRIEFWRDKLVGNRRRDTEAARKLVDEGFKVIVAWECAFRANRELAIAETATLIRNQDNWRVAEVLSRQVNAPAADRIEVVRN